MSSLSSDAETTSADTATAGGAATPPAATAAPTTQPVSELHHVVTLKLTRDNYLLWKTQLVPYLRGQGLYGYIDGTEVCPLQFLPPAAEGSSVPTVNPAYLVWQQQDQSILSAIISSVSDDLLTHLVEVETAHEAWDVLSRLFLSQLCFRAHTLKYELSSMKKGADSIDAYYLKVKCKAATLAAIGEPLRDSDFIAYLLAGLDSSYDSVVASIHMHIEPLSRETVYHYLIDHEDRLARNNHPVELSRPTQPTTHTATHGPISSRTSQPHEGGGGLPQQPQGAWQGFTHGHARQEWHGRGSNWGRGHHSPQSSHPLSCQLCLEPGHSGLQCPFRYNRSFQGVSHNPPVYIASAAPSYVDACYHDSEATHHITSNIRNLNLTAEPCNGHDQRHVGDEVLRTVRDIQPAHYLFKIESFSTMVEENIDKLESGDFEVGDYKWGLCLYPNGNKETNGSGYVSLYLVIKDADKLPYGWELNMHFKLFVYNHLEDNYLTVQDAGAKTRRFHAMKTEWGFSQLLSLDVFKDTSNGYLFQDSCVFGAEILVFKNSGKAECVSWIKEPENKCFTWKIGNFSAITFGHLFSDEFTIGEHKWKLCLYPKGDVHVRGEWLSVFLFTVNSFASSLKQRLYASYKWRIKDQISNKHFEKDGKGWFSSTSDNWGFPKFKKLSELIDSSNGFIVQDTLIVEVEFMVVSVAKKLS